MLHQTSIEQPQNGRERTHRPSDRNPVKSVFGNASQVVHDITELAELQAKLFAADLHATKKRAILPIVILVISVCLLLGVVPVALLGVAELLVQYGELARSTAVLLAAAAGLIIAGVMAVIAGLRLKNGLSELSRSKRELSRNIEWIKTSLKSGGHRHPKL